MSTHNKLDKICVVIVAVSLLLTVLFMNGESLGITMIVDEDAESYSGTTYFTTNDQNSDWDTEGATVITLTGDSAEITGNGAYVNGQEVVITEAGRYVVSGSLSDGKITVDAHNSSKVWILLDGVDINCSDDACIRVDQAEKVFLTLAENSVNTLTSGSTYSDTALQDGTDGAIFAHDDLTINGSGSLTVTAEYRHGIAANDDLVITGGTITITAAADAIHANDSVSIKDAQITVDAGDDGIVTANEVEEGYMYIESGTIDITSVGDGIHTTGDITITGGSITIAAGDDGIHSDQFVYIEDGEILINECYEGIEALIIDVSGGDITVYPEDDGFNANGGSSDMFGFGGGPGQGGMHTQTSDTDTAEGHASDTDTAEGQSSETDPVEGQASVTDTASEETYIAISGGTITIINDSGRDADGLDSNEDIRISGGTIYISLLGTGSNCAVDYGSESGGVAEITGGTIIACGASSMAEGFSSTSTQASILYNTSTVADEGTTLALEDEEGNILLSWDVPCSFSSALISCPEMQVGNSYQVVIGDSAEEITLEEISTSYGDAQSGMTGGDMGGGMQHGGDIQPGGGFEGWPFSDTTEGTASEDSTSEDSTENVQGDMPAMPEGMQEGHGGPGGHGGRGNGQTPPDMSQDGATEMQTPSDMNQDGTTESQTPTDMSQDGTTEGQAQPEMSQDGTTEGQAQPEMSQDSTTEGQAQPEMSQDSTAEDQISSEMSHDGHTGGPMMGEQGQQETSQEAEDQAEEQTVTAQTVDAGSWKIYGGCAALLIAAIAVSMIYKRH